MLKIFRKIRQDLLSELNNNQRFNETLKFSTGHLYQLTTRCGRIKPEVEALVEQIDAEIEQRNKL